MTSTAGVSGGNRLAAAARLQDLIPIAVVIAAGCESCAEGAVRRALQNGVARSQIERTLRIVAHFRSADCFQQAVGAEVARRMEGPLAAGVRVLREREDATETDAGGCCGTAGPSTPQGSV
jgi:AhpD family alkylhydroperoxidase